MFCQKCGTENKDDGTFCSKCGNDLKSVNPEIDIRDTTGEWITAESLKRIGAIKPERKGITGKLGEMGIPGFRSGKSWKMGLAIIGYYLIGTFLFGFIAGFFFGVSPSDTYTPSELILKVGETAKTSEKEVTVFSAQRTKSYNYNSSISEKNVIDDAMPGKIFVLVDVEIINVGSDRVIVHTGFFSVTDSEGYKYDTEIYWGDDNLQFQSIYQNQKSRGKILFEVPETAQKLKLQYDFAFSGTKLTSWQIT